MKKAIPPKPAEPVRFVYQRDMPDAMVEMLRDKLTISRYDSIVPGGRYHNFKDFIGFPNVGKANLVNKPLPRLRHLAVALGADAVSGALVLLAARAAPDRQGEVWRAIAVTVDRTFLMRCMSSPMAIAWNRSNCFFAVMSRAILEAPTISP